MRERADALELGLAEGLGGAGGMTLYPEFAHGG